MKHENPINMNRITHIALLLLLPITACNIDDTLYDTPHPDKGAVTVTTDCADTHRLMINETIATVRGETNVFPALLDEGNYTLTAFNTPEGMTATGGVVSVNTLPDGTLTPQPGELRSNVTQINVVKDDTLRVTLPLRQRTRRLTLKMTTEGGDASIIASTDAALTGIAPAIDVTTNKLTGTPATVKPLFTLADGVLTAEVNLLGVFPDEKQTFTITITATDGHQQILKQDLTEVLATFNQSTEPLILGATLELMLDASFGFNITDWTEGTSGTADAN